MNQKPKRLYKSRRDRMIDGVCGGFAEYLDVDPTMVRILWVLMTLMGGAGILLYIAGMIIMPVNPEHIVQTVPPPAGERVT
ncbi:MAG: PspC domain-containing protein, partial [Bacteroidota bacterium]